MAVTPESLRERAQHIRLLRVLEGHSGDVFSIAFSPDGRWLASGDNDRTVRVWEVSTGEGRRVWREEELSGAVRVWKVCFSPDGRCLAVASGTDSAPNHGVVRLWRGVGWQDSQIVARYEDDQAFSIALSPDGRWLACGLLGQTIRVYEVATGRESQVLTGHTDWVHDVCFSPDGTRLASSSQDSTVRVWEVATGQTLWELTGHDDQVNSLAFAPTGEQLASVSSDCTVRLWDLRTGQQTWTSAAATGSANAVVWSPDGSLIIARFGGNRAANAVRFWHPASGEVIHELPQRAAQDDHWWVSRALAISPDGRLLVTYAPDSLQTLHIWDISALDVGPRPAVRRPRRRVSSVDLDTPRLAHLRAWPLAHAQPPTPARPVAWLRSAGSLGIAPPLGLVQDLGSLLTQPRTRLNLARPAYVPADLDTSAYLHWLTRLAASPLLRTASTWDLSDAVIGAVLAKLCQGLNFPAAYRLPSGAASVHLAQQLSLACERSDPAQVWRDTDPAERPSLTTLLPPSAMAQVESNLRQLDVEELRFLHHYGPRLSGATDPRDLLDLSALLNLPPTVRLAVANVLRLLPRVSQGTQLGGTQTYAMGGYSGLTHTGNLDSLVPTELAYPEALFWHRLLNREALYYGRDGEQEPQRQLAYILTQMGLELLGDGDVLARALTLALSHSLQRRGYDVQHSFVGSQWTPPTGLSHPGEVHRLLYYRDTEWLEDAAPILTTVLQQLHAWKGQYRSRHVFWVIQEHWDADSWTAHRALYESLRQSAQQHAWFVRIGSEHLRFRPDGRPTAAPLFHRYQVVNNAMLLEGKT